MAQWSHSESQSNINQFDHQIMSYQPCYQEVPMPPPAPQQPLVTFQSHLTPQAQPSTSQASDTAMNIQNADNSVPVPARVNPRESRNKAEKIRRDQLNQSISELAKIVPPVLAARRKVDKTTVLRLTAHYLRANHHVIFASVFGDSINRSQSEFSVAAMMKIMGMFNGFLITVTYRGIIVVVSENVKQYLGYAELELVGQNLLNFTHESDRDMLQHQLMPRTQKLGPRGELIYPDEPGAQEAAKKALAQEKRKFLLRLKVRQRSGSSQYLSCQVEGAMRMSDRATGVCNRSSQVVRRIRARSQNPYSSGNDIVFIAMVRPATTTFMNECYLESSCMEYRTRHTIDGLIIHCDARIAMVAGYTPFEVCGHNAMSFMHRDDVRWVVVALREMYDQQRRYGESCYRLMTRNREFIYMKTRGHLEVDEITRACTSFVCINTVVDSKEGKYLIRQMKKKFSVRTSKHINAKLPPTVEEIRDEDDHKKIAIVHPKYLKPVIFCLVVNLPSPQRLLIYAQGSTSPDTDISAPQPIAIIPPTREKIVGGINKINNIIKELDNEPDVDIQSVNGDMDEENPRASSAIFDKPITETANEIAEAPTDLGFLDDWTDYWTATLNSDNQNMEYVHEDGQKLSWNEVVHETMPEPSTNETSGGIKRPIYFDDVDIMSKKKYIEVVSQSGPLSVCCTNVSSIENSVDEILSNSQTDVAMNSLNTAEPTLPDLLATLDDDKFSEYLQQFENDQDDIE